MLQLLSQWTTARELMHREERPRRTQQRSRVLQWRLNAARQINIKKKGVKRRARIGESGWSIQLTKGSHPQYTKNTHVSIRKTV